MLQFILGHFSQGFCVCLCVSRGVRVYLQVCAVERRCSITLCPQHEGRQDVAGGEERQLDKAPSRGVMVAGIACVHGQMPTDWRGLAQRAEASQASSRSSPCASRASCSSRGGRGVGSRVLLLPFGSPVLEPDLNLGLSEGEGQGQVEALTH